MIGPVIPISLGTLRGFSRDRIFYSTILFAIFLILFAYFLGTLTFVETRKILLDFGLSAVSLCGIAIAFFVGISSVGKELENKTIYSVLSKPISRTSYLIGKYLGASLVCLITQAFMSITLVLIISSIGEGVPPGLFSCFYLMALESLLMLAVAVFFSITLSSSFLAGCLSFGVFLIGRSSNSFQAVAERSSSPFTKWALRVCYDIFPMLERFNIRELVAYGKPFPTEMLPWGTLYFLVYALFFLSAAAAIFQRKDLP